MARAQAQATAQTPTAARATAQAQVRATQAEAEAANSFTAAGRVWKKEPAERTMNWADAKAHCARPWRLPSKDELLALYHGGFVDSEDGPYWSSSVPDNPPGWATYVNVRGFALDLQTYAWLRVRCVR
jgi:hypothetical protein